MDASDDNQLWRQESDGRIRNKKSGKYLGSRTSILNLIQDKNGALSWSFNTNIRSNQEPASQPIVQKLQATGTNNCLNTANRFYQTGSKLISYPCNRVHPENACFKFIEAILITGGNGANGGLNEAALFRLYFPEFKVAT